MKKLTFKKGLLLLAIVYAAVIAVGLSMFYAYLERYEAGHPVGAMNAYFAALKKGNTADIIENSEFPFDAHNTESIYIEYLTEKYKNGDGHWQYASIDDDADPNTDTYAVYEDGKQYGTLYLTRDGDGWRVRSDWAYTQEMVLSSPYPLLVNGAPLTMSCIKKPIELFAQALEEPLFTSDCTVKTLRDPVVTLEDGEAVLSEQESGVLVTKKPQETDSKALAALAETVARTYACFISGDATLEEMHALVKAGTPFMTGLRAYDPKWYNRHVSVEFQNMQVSDVVMWSDTAFSVDVRFDFVVNRAYDSHTYPTAYQLAFEKVESGFQTVNIIPL